MEFVNPVFIVGFLLILGMVALGKKIFDINREQRLEDNDRLIVAKSMVSDSSSDFEQGAVEDEDMGYLAKRLHRAGINQSPMTFVLLVASISFLAFFISFFLSKNPVIPFVLILLVIVLSHLYVSRQIKRQKLRFEEQFGRACSQIAGSVRTGITIDRAIRSVAAYMDDPLRSEFMLVAAECAYDPDVASALKRMARRMGSNDAMLFASMIELNQRKGGKMADSVERLSETISTRLAMRRHIRSETASGKAAGVAVVVITLLLIVAMFVTNPEFLDFYFNNPFGPICAGIAGLLFILGTVLIAKMTDVDMD